MLEDQTPLERISEAISETINEKVSNAVSEKISKDVGEAVIRAVGEVIGDAVNEAITEATGKIADAIVIAEEMLTRFAEHYEDPAAHTPYITAEGGYQYLCGGPYNARDEIENHFPKPAHIDLELWEKIVNIVVDEIEADGVTDWAKVIDDQEPEPPVRLLRAYPHDYGPGRTHLFDEAKSKTLCGRTHAACPGELRYGDEGAITCETCKRILERRATA
jgi:hypothetical protein